MKRGRLASLPALPRRPRPSPSRPRSPRPGVAVGAEGHAGDRARRAPPGRAPPGRSRASHSRTDGVPVGGRSQLAAVGAKGHAPGPPRCAGSEGKTPSRSPFPDFHGRRSCGSARDQPAAASCRPSGLKATGSRTFRPWSGTEVMPRVRRSRPRPSPCGPRRPRPGVSPSGLKATPRTAPVWPARVTAPHGPVRRPRPSPCGPRWPRPGAGRRG